MSNAGKKREDVVIMHVYIKKRFGSNSAALYLLKQLSFVISNKGGRKCVNHESDGGINYK